MQYSTSHVAVLRLCCCHKMASEAISEHLISNNFLEADPYMLMRAYIRIRQSCNLLNPGYGPNIICKVSIRENIFFFFCFCRPLSTSSRSLTLRNSLRDHTWKEY